MLMQCAARLGEPGRAGRGGAVVRVIEQIFSAGCVSLNSVTYSCSVSLLVLVTCEYCGVRHKSNMPCHGRHAW